MLTRRATPADAAAIAALHAESWRGAYRGIYSDEYLDDRVHADRLAVWTERFAAGVEPGTITILLEDDGELVGLAHTILDDDPTWGALLDNLHAHPARKRQGIGRRLMAETAHALVAERPGQPLHLWVLEDNTGAQAFYRRIGGEIVEAEPFTAPDGNELVGLRVVWTDPAALRDGVGRSPT